jgi:hypothetical protein
MHQHSGHYPLLRYQYHLIDMLQPRSPVKAMQWRLVVQLDHFLTSSSPHIRRAVPNHHAQAAVLAAAHALLQHHRAHQRRECAICCEHLRLRCLHCALQDDECCVAADGAATWQTAGQQGSSDVLCDSGFDYMQLLVLRFAGWQKLRRC